jgi:hypothetical protein
MTPERIAAYIIIWTAILVGGGYIGKGIALVMIALMEM